MENELDQMICDQTDKLQTEDDKVIDSKSETELPNNNINNSETLKVSNINNSKSNNPFEKLRDILPATSNLWDLEKIYNRSSSTPRSDNKEATEENIGKDKRLTRSHKDSNVDNPDEIRRSGRNKRTKTGN